MIVVGEEEDRLYSKDDKSGDLDVLELFSGVGVGCHGMKSLSVAADVSDWSIMPY